jgi:hypothetical protein
MQVGSHWLQCTARAGSHEAAQYRDTALETLLDYGRVAHQRGGSCIVYLDRPATVRSSRSGIASGASAGIPDLPGCPLSLE